MKNTKGLLRDLVGVLLLLNALPYSLGGNDNLLFGMLFMLSGCAVVAWPVILEVFSGPSGDAEARFGPWDAVRVMAAAVILVLVVVVRQLSDGLAPVLLFAVGLLLLYLKPRLPSRRLVAMGNALNSVEQLHKLAVVTDAERSEMDSALGERIDADVEARVAAADRLAEARAQVALPSWLLLVLVVGCVLSCVALLGSNHASARVALPVPIATDALLAAAVPDEAPPVVDDVAPAIIPAAVMVATPEPTAEPAASGLRYAASSESDKYHLPGCRWADEILDDNLIWFDSIEAAQAAGYTACDTCHPD